VKGDLVSLSEQIDTTTAAGKMMFQMLAVLSEFERNLTAERTSGALQHKKATGQKYTNQTPYGFEAVEGRLVEVAQEAEVVAQIQMARAGGTTLQSIADGLNGRGIPTKTGKQWAPATIHLLLKRTALVSAH
jgi:site-specific DNA recombinase